MSEKVGVYICHCGTNIAGTVDVEGVARWAGGQSHVAVARDYKFMCSSLGQELIEKDIKELGLTRVVVAACSPHMHEKTFRMTCQRAGLNPFLFEMANIREHDSWVTHDKGAATGKAKALIKAAIERVIHHQPLEPLPVDINPNTLIVGGGIAGITAALELANAGYHVYLVEREPSIGGHMAQLDKTFPTLDCSACLPYSEEIILGDGTFVPIGDLVEGFNPGVDRRTVLSQNGRTCEAARIVDVQKLPAPRHLIEIETRTGLSLRLTPDHRVLVDSPEGPIWLESQFLRPGHRLYAPRKIAIQTTDMRVVDLLPDDVLVVNPDLKQMAKEVLQDTFGSLENAAKKLGIRVKNLYQGERHLFLGDLRTICMSTHLEWEEIAGKIKTITYKGGHHTEIGSEYVSRDLLYLIGLIASDGSVSSSQAERLEVQFANTDSALVEAFSRAYQTVFPNRPIRFHPHSDGAQATSIKNRLLAAVTQNLIANHFKPVFKLREDLIAAFLQGYFDGDGSCRLHGDGTGARIYYHFGRDEVARAESIHLLLKRIGILSNIFGYQDRVNLEIANHEDVRQFIYRVDSCHSRKKERLAEILQILEGRTKSQGGVFESLPLECGRLLHRIRTKYAIPATNLPISRSNSRAIEQGEWRVTRPTLHRLVTYLQDSVPPDDADLQRLRRFLEWDFYLDEVANVRNVPKDGEYVYDITVEGTHRFIPKGAFVVSNCILTPKMVEVDQHPNITLLSYSEVEKVDGYLGNFTVTVRKKARHVNEDLCTGCGICEEKCPRRVVDEAFEAGLGRRKVIYRPFPQAVPKYPVIDVENCVYFQRGKCKACQIFCPTNAIDFEQQDEILEIKVGNVIVATGYDLFDVRRIPQYGYGRLANVFTSLEFERMVNAAGPTGGKIVLRDMETPPKSVAIIHCVGSRDQNYHVYCSKVCCMYSLKFAHLIHERLPGTEVYNCYIDMRTPGKGYEEFYHRLLEEGAHFIRGKVAEVTDAARLSGEEGKLIVQVEDTLIGKQRRIPVDMVILSPAMEARHDSPEVANLFSMGCDFNGFFIERHPKLDPVATMTEGVFIAGACQGPKDIPDSVAQGAAAAARVASLISQGTVLMEPVRARINEDKCCGCRICNNLCPYNAIVFHADRKVSEVITALCQGCGACVAACPSAAITGAHFTFDQVMAEIEGILWDVRPLAVPAAPELVSA